MAEDESRDEARPGEGEPAEGDAGERTDQAGPDGDAQGSPEAPPRAESPWQEKTRLAWELWDAGDNARLRPLVAELERAPESEAEARQAARELARRLRPDPIAIAIWVLSLVAFSAITYLFVLR